MVNSVMVVSVLISTVTFGAAFTVPGGFNASDDPKRGMAVLGDRVIFQLYVIFNSVAFCCSTLGSLLLLWAQFGEFLAVKFYLVASHLVGVALVTKGLAFLTAIRLYVTPVSWLANFVTIIGVMFFFLISSLYTFGAFPLGYYRMPVLRQVSYFFLRIYISLLGTYPKVKAKKLESFASSRYDIDVEKKDQPDEIRSGSICTGSSSRACTS